MTALTATPQAPTATVPPSMLVAVTGAPSPPATAYTSNFTAGVDSWANGGSATLTGNVTVPGTSTKSLQIDGPTTLADATAQRALTGLTVAAPYRYRATVVITRGEVKLVAKDTASGTVLAQTSFVTYANPTNKTLSLSLDFTPTAAAVTIQIVIHQVTAFGGSTATVYAHTITVSPTGTWQGTTVYRTDVNGTDVPVREDVAGQDTSGGTMTLTDYEAALVGPVTYRVLDGAGASTTAATVSHSEARRNLARNPTVSVNTTDWGFGVGTTAIVVTSTRVAPDGALVTELGQSLAYYRATVTNAGNGTVGGAGWVIGSPNADFIPVTALRPLAVTAYARSSQATRTAQIVLTFHDAAGTQVGSFNGAPAVIGAGFARLTALGTVPAGATRVYMRVYSVGGNAHQVGDTFDVGGILVEHSATVSAYLDGDSPNTGATRHAWVGAAGASQSIETAEAPALGVWLTLPATAVPSTPVPPSSQSVPLVIGYDAEAATTGSIHQIIGRADKIANPGPLSTRSGTMTLLELDYAGARAIRTLLANGDVAMLRQPTHAGLDLYFTTTSVHEAPEGDDTRPTRFGVVVAFEEVVAP